MPVLMQMQMRSVLCSFSGSTQYISYMHSSLLHSSSMKHTWLVICKPILVCQKLVIEVCIIVYMMLSRCFTCSIIIVPHFRLAMVCTGELGCVILLVNSCLSVIVQLSGLMNHSETA